MNTTVKLVSIALAGAVFVILNAGPAWAPRYGRFQSESAEQPSVEITTKREWNRVKRSLQKRTAKWESCNKEAKDRSLKGRKSWSAIASCMKS